MTPESFLLDRFLIWIPLVISLSVHEWAHAYSAYQLGDETASSQGRMTLDPLAHIDPIGTLVLPMLGVPFGWAKPVPIDPSRFRGSIDAGIVLTALAGPVANVALALVSVGGLVLASRIGAPPSALGVLEMLVAMNLLLAAFNLLPVVPLDGSRIVEGLVPASLRSAWDTWASLGPITLVAVIGIPVLLGIPLLEWPFRFAHELVAAATS